MTGFADNITSGLNALTSGQSSNSPVQLSRTFRFTGGGTTNQSFVLPTGVQNLDAKCYILQQGSAATSDAITVSAGGTTLLTFSSMGSALGVVRQTTAGLGTLTVVASACANLSTTAEVSADIKIASVDTATDYQVELMFTRLRVDPLGN
jgi:hypothetical protein